ncbi:MAG: hypothetical protein ACXVB9_18860 [Bdellovibrionota bacterium]
MKSKFLFPLLASIALCGVFFLGEIANKSPGEPQAVPAAPNLPAASPAPATIKAPTDSADELERALATNELGVAETILQKAEPDSELALEGRPKLLIRENNVEGARAALATCLEKFPKSYSCLSTRVEAEMSSGTQESQQTAVQECLKSYPNDPACRNWLGIVELSDGNGKNAVKIYQSLLEEKVPKLEPRYLAWQLAKAEELSGDTKAARVYYSRACKLNNMNACAWLQSRR